MARFASPELIICINVEDEVASSTAMQIFRDRYFVRRCTYLYIIIICSFAVRFLLFPRKPVMMVSLPSPSACHRFSGCLHWSCGNHIPKLRSGFQTKWYFNIEFGTRFAWPRRRVRDTEQYVRAARRLFNNNIIIDVGRHYIHTVHRLLYYNNIIFRCIYPHPPRTSYNTYITLYIILTTTEYSYYYYYYYIVIKTHPFAHVLVSTRS